MKRKHWTRIGKKNELIHNIWTWINSYNPWRFLPSPYLIPTPLPSIPLMPKNLCSRKTISSPQFLQHAFTLKFVSSNSPHMPYLYSIQVCAPNHLTMNVRLIFLKFFILFFSSKNPLYLVVRHGAWFSVFLGQLIPMLGIFSTVWVIGTGR